jgi:hypothetical protein
MLKTILRPYTAQAPFLGHCIVLACSQDDAPWTHKHSGRETCIPSPGTLITQICFPAIPMRSDTVKALLAGLQGPMTHAEALLGDAYYAAGAVCGIALGLRKLWS